MSKNLNGLLSISRPTGRDGNYVHLQIKDAASRLPVADFEISMEEWAEACFSLMDRPGKLETWDNYKTLGSVHECKSVWVYIPSEAIKPFKYSLYKSLEVIEQLLAPAILALEVDGWKIRRDLDIFCNGHRSRCVNESGSEYKITLDRYVKGDLEIESSDKNNS